MTNTMKIKVPALDKREWASLEDLKKVWTVEEILEIVQRYCDTQDRATKYRVNHAAKVKAALAAYDQIQKGTRVVMEAADEEVEA